MATSKLQIAVGDLLDKTFPQYHIKENYRPEWLRSSNLTKLELDFYVEELKIAFEIQGTQHCQYIPFFYKCQQEYNKRIQYDQEKKDLCYGLGVRLIEIWSYYDALIEIKGLQVKYSPTVIQERNRISHKLLQVFEEFDYSRNEYHEFMRLRHKFEHHLDRYITRGKLKPFWFEFLFISSPKTTILTDTINHLIGVKLSEFPG